MLSLRKVPCLPSAVAPPQVLGSSTPDVIYAHTSAIFKRGLKHLNWHTFWSHRISILVFQIHKYYSLSTSKWQKFRIGTSFIFFLNTTMVIDNIILNKGINYLLRDGKSTVKSVYYLHLRSVNDRRHSLKLTPKFRYGNFPPANFKLAYIFTY